MEILIIEDSKEKFDQVEAITKTYFKDDYVEVIRCEDMAGATKNIYEKKFDLIITDLLLPPRHGDTQVDLSDEITATIQDSKLNRATSTIALSAFSDIIEERRRYFSDLGIFLVEYDDASKWVNALEMCFQRVAVKARYEFVIFCALEKERSAYRAAGCTVGEPFVARGLNCLRVEIDGKKGLCIRMPRAGLVDAGIVAAKAIELYSPKIVAMSGICAGVKGHSSIGSLVIASFTWEYQVGKFNTDGFKIEPYQVHLEGTHVMPEIENFIGRDAVGLKFKDNTFSDTDVLYKPVVMGPVASGSAVVADPKRVKEISEQQRKMSAIDMEMHAVYRACELAPERPVFFGAKTVVDMANSNKGDEHHVNGSIVSARFTVALISHLTKLRH